MFVQLQHNSINYNLTLWEKDYKLSLTNFDKEKHIYPFFVLELGFRVCVNIALAALKLTIPLPIQ